MKTYDSGSIRGCIDETSTPVASAREMEENLDWQRSLTIDC